jgi:hypothetical protein
VLNTPLPINRPFVTAASLEAAEARAGAYRLAHDHLAITVGTLLGTSDALYTGHGTVDAYERALQDVRNTIGRDVESYLTDPPLNTGGVLPTNTKITTENHGCVLEEPSSVPSARTQEASARSFGATSSEALEAAGVIAEQLRTAADARAARSVLGPLRQIVPDEPTQELPVAGTWGPYETEDEALLEPMPVAVSELFDAGLVRSGDPENLVQNVVLAHVIAACEAVGIRRGTFDDRVLEWLARLDVAVGQVLIGLVRRAYAAGAASLTDVCFRCGANRPVLVLKPIAEGRFLCRDTEACVAEEKAFYVEAEEPDRA